MDGLRKNTGFTLLEVIVILTILAILAVLPFYNWPGSTISLDAQAQQIASDIRYTQALAMSKAERYRFVRTSATTYQIQNSSGVAITLPSGSETATLNSNLTFGTWGNLPNNLITFDSRGTPYLDSGSPGTALSPGTVYSIPILGGSENETITVSPISGKVSL